MSSIIDNQTTDVIEMTGSIDTALAFHLQSRVFPSRMEMFGTAKAAIQLAKEGDWYAFVDLPEGVTHRRYGSNAPVEEVFNHLNLWCFVVEEDGEE